MQIREQLHSWAAVASRLPVAGILIRARLKASKDLAKDMAASIAFFTFLSIFPLLLGLFAIAGAFLRSEELRARLIALVIELIPARAELITQNVETVVRLQGAAGITSVIVLLWSARKMVAAIRRGVNNALEQEKDIAFYLSPLYDYAVTLLVALLTLIAIGLAPVLELIVGLETGLLSSRWQAILDTAAGHVSSLIVSAALLTLIYMLVAYERPGWKQAMPGIAVATCLIEAGKSLFVYYVEHASRFDSVYGSLSSMIVLLIWLYFSARVLLYGAEVICICVQDAEP